MTKMIGISKESSLLDSFNNIVFRLLPMLFFVVILVYFFFFYDAELSQNSFALFGDYFGGILNPILSFLAVWMLLVSIRLQAHELSETRQELRETKEIHRSNLELAQENIKSQERLFAIEVITNEIRGLEKVADDANRSIASVDYYTLDGPIYLKPASLLSDGDIELLAEMESYQRCDFIFSYKSALEKYIQILERLNGYLKESRRQELNIALLPISQCKAIISTANSIKINSSLVTGFLSGSNLDGISETGLQDIFKYLDLMSDKLDEAEVNLKAITLFN